MNLRFHLIARCHRVLLSMAALACTLPMTMPSMADDTTAPEEAPLGHDPLVSLMQELRAQVLNEADDPRSAINNCPGARKRLGLPFDPQARLPTPGDCEEMERHLLTAKVPLQVRAISHDGKPVDITSLAQIEVCDDTKCHAIQPLPDVKTVDGNTSGRAGEDRDTRHVTAPCAHPDPQHITCCRYRVREVLGHDGFRRKLAPVRRWRDPAVIGQ